MSDELTREKIIAALVHEKLPRSILESVAKRERSPLGEGIINSLGKMNDRTLTTLYRALIKGDQDEKGTYLTYRSALWLSRELKTPEIRLTYAEPLVGELKVVIFLEGEISVAADCINSKVTFADIDGFISKLKLLKGKHTHLNRSFIFSSAGYDDDLAEKINKMEGMGSDGTFTAVKKGRFSGLMGGGSNEVKIALYEETGIKQMTKVYP